MSAIIVERTFTCRSDVERLWPLITDTEALNRALGSGPITLRPNDDASAARYLVTTRLAGFSLEYEERPFEWVYPTRFSIVRRMRSGPVRELSVGWRMATLGEGGTRLTLSVGLTPSIGLLSPVIKIIANRSADEMRRTILRFDEALASGAPRPDVTARRTIHDAAFARATAALRSDRDRLVEKDIAERLSSYVRDADDVDLSRMRPFELADTWGVDRRALLSGCLAAVHAGLLELRWEVICPSCRTGTETLPSLSALSEHGGCQLCEIEFAIDLDEAVEVTFAPCRAVREVDAGPYCIGGPARTPHVLAQAILPASGTASLTAPSELGNYRLFVRGGAARQVEVREGAPAEIKVDPRAETGGIAIAPGGAVRVENPSAEELHAKIERVVWGDQAARARVVTAMPGFRRDFSTDILRPGLALRVARVGLLFTDLTGSTELYATIGDAAAFKLVQDHFEVLRRLIEEASGTIVKTIGDAVMAVFSDDAEALRASIAILHAFDAFRGEAEHGDRTHIKLGIFGGSCYAVTANGALDYFGQTVNIAARLQGEAKSGEIVATEELVARGVEARLLPEAFVVERWDAKLKGLRAPIRAARIKIPV